MSSESQRGFVPLIGAVAPDFVCKTTKGEFLFHTFLSQATHFTMLCSHPRDFTPVCTTEVGRIERLFQEGEFQKRGVKPIGLSCDSLENHEQWEKDVMFREQKNWMQCKSCSTSLSFPIIADESREIVTLMGILDPHEKNAEGLPIDCRSLFVFDPNKRLVLFHLFPTYIGQSFVEILRVLDGLSNLYGHPSYIPPERQLTSSFAPLSETGAKPQIQRRPSLTISKGLDEEANTGWKARIGSEAPDFVCRTPRGSFQFHDYISRVEEDVFLTLLFTHSGDLSPLSREELREWEELNREGEFRRRGVQLIGVTSCGLQEQQDLVEDACMFQKRPVLRVGLSFPLVADSDQSILKTLGLLDPSKTNNSGRPHPGSALLVFGTDKRLKLLQLYPALLKNNLHEILRVLDGLWLINKHPVAIPAGWRPEDQVFLRASHLSLYYGHGEVEEVPSGKKYLRMIEQPFLPSSSRQSSPRPH